MRAYICIGNINVLPSVPAAALRGLGIPPHPTSKKSDYNQLSVLMEFLSALLEWDLMKWIYQNKMELPIL